MGVIEEVMDPGREEFGFEQPALDTSVIGLGAPPWTANGTLTATVVGDAGTFSGVQSARVVPQSGASRWMSIPVSPAIQTQSAARFSMALKLSHVDTNAELAFRLEDSSVPTLRALWIIMDNGSWIVRSDAGGAVTFGSYEADHWYELVVEKDAWSSGAEADVHTFAVRIYDTEDTGALHATGTAYLNDDIVEFDWLVIDYYDGIGGVSRVDVDHFGLMYSDDGDTLPPFVQLNAPPKGMIIIVQ